MLVGISDHVKEPYDIEAKAFPQARFVYLHPEVLGSLDALLVWNAYIDESTAVQLKSCKIVVRYGVGVDNVDAIALKKRGILFSNTPDYGTEEVADTTLAMILVLQRKIFSYDLKARDIAEGWRLHSLSPLSRLSKISVGVIGVGRIGTAVVNRLKPFGVKIYGYDPYQPSGHEKAIGYRRTFHLTEILHKSDIITIHCPLTSETKGMIDQAFLSSMKFGSILINTARGKILKNFDCLYHALRTEHLSGVGLDVLPDEPPHAHPLITAWKDQEDWLLGRFMINPHTAYFSDEAWYEMRFKAAETAALFLEKGIHRNRIC